ncbi:MAG: glycerate kinase [Dehalococcoidales bacterium]|nr:glycerate kinase [Dehalococcoidales bacterium]
MVWRHYRNSDVMKIVIAPQGFKGNLTALEVSRAISRGIKHVIPDVVTVIVPMADGGEGTMQALVDAIGGNTISVEVTDPIGERITARWAMLSDGVTAVIEMAEASGLDLIPPEKRNPLLTTTYGTGELIRDALAKGCRKFIIGIGGSATNDGGAGMAQALGIKLINAKGAAIATGGAALIDLADIDTTAIDPRLADCDILLACDVTNPLCGPEGASFVYGPQKGATPEMVLQLDTALAHYADVIQRKLGADIRDIPGAGAAGGLGAGLIAFLKARVLPGIDIVIQATSLAEKMRGANLVFTGEGRIDNQTASGKTPVGVARKAKEFGLPVIAITGEIGNGYSEVYREGIDTVFSIAPGPISFSQSTEMAEQLITDVAERAMRLFICKRQPG